MASASPTFCFSDRLLVRPSACLLFSPRAHLAFWAGIVRECYCANCFLEIWQGKRMPATQVQVNAGKGGPPPGGQRPVINRVLIISAICALVVTLLVAWLIGQPGVWAANIALLWSLAAGLAAGGAALAALSWREGAAADAAEREARRAYEQTAHALNRAEARMGRSEQLEQEARDAHEETEEAQSEWPFIISVRPAFAARAMQVQRMRLPSFPAFEVTVD